MKALRKDIIIKFDINQKETIQYRLGVGYLKMLGNHGLQVELF
jgi:hypothetical protein